MALGISSLPPIQREYLKLYSAYEEPKIWNAHWLLDETEWETITKGQIFSLNRRSYSQHLKMIIDSNFALLNIQKRIYDNELEWTDLANQFQWMTLEDLKCSGLHVIAQKIMPDSKIPTSDT